MFTPLSRGLAKILAERWEAAAEEAQAMLGGPEPTRRWFGSQLQTAYFLYRGRSADALAAAEQGVRAYPVAGARSAVSRRARAVILLARSQLDAAHAEATRARAEARNTLQEAAILTTAAVILARMGKRAELDATLAELTALSSPLAEERDDRRVQYTRGVAALAAGDAATAIPALERAQRSLPPRGTAPPLLNPHVMIWSALGEAYLAAGRLREAAQSFQRIADGSYERAAFPLEYVRSFYFLGTIHERLGDAARARDAYGRFVGYWKDGDLDRPRVAEAERKLAALR